MPSKELIEKVARAIIENPPKINRLKDMETLNFSKVVDHTPTAEAVISTIRAALLEPNVNQEQSGMREIMGGTGYVNHEIYIDPETPWHTWRAMLAASALVDQSE